MSEGDERMKGNEQDKDSVRRIQVSKCEVKRGIYLKRKNFIHTQQRYCNEMTRIRWDFLSYGGGAVVKPIM